MVLNSPNNSNFTFINSNSNNGNDNITMELSTPIPSDNRHQMVMFDAVISFCLPLALPRDHFRPEQSPRMAS